MIAFDNKTVLVTGGNRGIGAACVRLFAKLGANVSFTYNRNKSHADALAEELHKNSTKFFYAPCEVSNKADVFRFVSETLEKFNKIDVLINNAGIWEYGAIDTMTEKMWHKTIKTNLDSIFFFTKEVVSHMKKDKISGRIINIASTAGQRGEAYHSHYAASKGAIISFTKSLATELGPDGIYVNCVAPGWVETDMSRKAIDQAGEELMKIIPLKVVPQAEDIAKPIVFLASDWANAITGEILNVNSGSVLCG
jgi:3-oxoacyl-[acyl-carrier protein] reductase